MSPTNAVRVEALWKRFGYRSALAGIDLVIPCGEIFAILGPNGAGKSTLLRVLATRVRPNSGRVEVLGQNVLRRPAKALSKLGVVFHESCLRGDLTLDENLRFFSSLYGVDGTSKATEPLLDRLGLGDRRHDLVRTFSRGLMQRATVIRSLLHDPGVWLLDEPLSGLDPDGQALIENLVGEENKKGRTVVIVTHNLALGTRLASNGVVIDRGEIAARGLDEVQSYFAKNSVKNG